MITTLTSKGQLTLPKEIRERLNLKTGDKIQFIINEAGKIELTPLTLRLTALKGLLPPPEKTVTLEEMAQAIAEEGGQN